MQQQFNLTPAFLDLRNAGFVLGLSYQTVRNQIHLDTFPIKTVKIGGRRMVVYDDLLRFVDEVKSGSTHHVQPEVEHERANPQPHDLEKRGRGRPRNGLKKLTDPPPVISTTDVTGVGHALP